MHTQIYSTPCWAASKILCQGGNLGSMKYLGGWSPLIAHGLFPIMARSKFWELSIPGYLSFYSSVESLDFDRQNSSYREEKPSFFQVLLVSSAWPEKMVVLDNFYLMTVWDCMWFILRHYSTHICLVWQLVERSIPIEAYQDCLGFLAAWTTLAAHLITLTWIICWYSRTSLIRIEPDQTPSEYMKFPD